MEETCNTYVMDWKFLVYFTGNSLFDGNVIYSIENTVLAIILEVIQSFLIEVQWKS